MTMTMDDARLNVARGYNDLIEARKQTPWTDDLDQIDDALFALRASIGLLMGLYSDDIEGDCNSLLDQINLEIPNQ